LHNKRVGRFLPTLLKGKELVAAAVVTFVSAAAAKDE
jgi:hypothetical protein